MNKSQNTITINPAPGANEQTAVIFKAPDNDVVARSLWVFLVEKLQPGFIVELSNGIDGIERSSGQSVPPELYAELMDGE